MNVVCCQEEVSATGRSRVQSSRTECGVSQCDREASMGGGGGEGEGRGSSAPYVCRAMKIKLVF